MSSHDHIMWLGSDDKHHLFERLVPVGGDTKKPAQQRWTHAEQPQGLRSEVGRIARLVRMRCSNHACADWPAGTRGNRGSKPRKRSREILQLLKVDVGGGLGASPVHVLHWWMGMRVQKSKGGYVRLGSIGRVARIVAVTIEIRATREGADKGVGRVHLSA